MGSNVRTVLLGSITAIMLVSVIVPVTISTRAFAQSQITINGAGATFPFPIIDTWRVQYKNVLPAVNINYASIGSGGGIKQFTNKTVDFGASDAPLSDSERAGAPGAVHIPESIGSVTAAYNIPEIPNKGLKLTGPVLASIFLGNITKWNDPQITSINPGMPLPSQTINVVHRSDGSGTTFIWTSYLSQISPDWSSKVGAGKSVQWPTGTGASGNEGVATAIKGNLYTLGYVELAYALTTKMAYAFLQNQAGNFIEPTLDSTQAAVTAAAQNLPAGDASWKSVSLLNAPGDNSYPIASFTYLLLYKDMSTNPKIDQAKAQAIVSFIAWAVKDGQNFASPLGYVPLPASVVNHDLDTLASLTYQGTSLAPNVPEFPMVSALVLAASVAAIVGVSAYSRSRGAGLVSGGF